MLQADMGLTPVLLSHTMRRAWVHPLSNPAVGHEDIDVLPQPPKGAWLLQTLLVHPASAHPGSLSTDQSHFFPAPGPQHDSKRDLCKIPL